MTTVDNTYIPKEDMIHPGVPKTITQSNSSVGEEDSNIIVNCPTVCVLHLPNPGNVPGKSYTIQNYTANSVSSNVANVVSLDGSVTGVSILVGVIGKWVKIVSDGYNWITTKGN